MYESSLRLHARTHQGFRGLTTPTLAVFACLFVGFVGDYYGYWTIDWLPALAACIFVFLSSLVSIFRSAGMAGVAVFALLILFVALVYRFVYTQSMSIRDCTNYKEGTIPEEKLIARYPITRVIQERDSASGNAVYLVRSPDSPEQFILKYYSATDSAAERIGFACSLKGELGGVFPKTVENGTAMTNTGEVYYTVQTLAKGQPVDSWMKTAPDETKRRRAAREVLQQIAVFQRQSFCHRDLHPGNVFVDASGAVAFIDVDMGFIAAAPSDLGESELKYRCQRFFFEMPKKLLAFARANLSRGEFALLMGWWLYTNTQQYNVFSVDQLYGLVTAFVLRKDTGMLSYACRLKICDETAWNALVTGNYPATSAPLGETLTDGLLASLSGVGDIDLAALLFRYSTGVFGSGSNVQLSESAKQILLSVAAEFETTGKMPGLSLFMIWGAATTIPFKVFRRFPFYISIPNGTQVSAKLRSAGGAAADIFFSQPVGVGTTGIRLDLTSIGIDKSDSSKTDYELAGRVAVAGFPLIDIATLLGSVSMPVGPLPSGNEVLALVQMVELGIDPMELLKASGQNVSVLISLNDKNIEAKFENGIITVT
jgi:uncharacterized protein with PQ loop repeat